MYERQIIEDYFYDGFRYLNIVRFLWEYHYIDMSERTLRHRLLDYGLHWRMQPSSLADIWSAIHIELQVQVLHVSSSYIFFTV